MLKKSISELLEIGTYIILILNIFTANASSIFGSDNNYSNQRMIFGWLFLFLFVFRKLIFRKIKSFF